jgi:hypothetical protein
MLKWDPKWEMPPNDPLNAWTDYLPKDKLLPEDHGGIHHKFIAEDSTDDSPRGLIGTAKVMAKVGGKWRARSKAECHRRKGLTLYYYSTFDERHNMPKLYTSKAMLIYYKGERVCADELYERLPPTCRALKNWATWRYPEGIYPSERKVTPEFAEFYPEEQVRQAMRKAWDAGKMRWKHSVHIPFEFDHAEKYLEWLTIEGPYAYVDDEPELIRRFDEFEELTGEPLPNKAAIVEQAVATRRTSKKLREEYFKTQKKI